MYNRLKFDVLKDIFQSISLFYDYIINRIEYYKTNVIYNNLMKSSELGLDYIMNLLLSYSNSISQSSFHYSNSDYHYIIQNKDLFQLSEHDSINTEDSNLNRGSERGSDNTNIDNINENDIIYFK